MRSRLQIALCLFNASNLKIHQSPSLNLQFFTSHWNQEKVEKLEIEGRMNSFHPIFFSAEWEITLDRWVVWVWNPDFIWKKVEKKRNIIVKKRENNGNYQWSFFSIQTMLMPCACIIVINTIFFSCKKKISREHFEFQKKLCTNVCFVLFFFLLNIILNRY